MADMNLDSFATREPTPTFGRICEGAHQALDGWLNEQRQPSPPQLSMLWLLHGEMSQWQDRQPNGWNPVPHSSMTAALRLFICQCEGRATNTPACPKALQATRDYLRILRPAA